MTAPMNGRPVTNDHVAADLVIVGGGLAGVCAAIAAARAGVSVALVHNRSVLGGNSSSEIRVWVVGATAHGVQINARETGIMGELFVENEYRNPEGNPYYWDLVVEEFVRAEPLITLYLNCDVVAVDADDTSSDKVIRSVTGWQQGSERWITFTAPMFADCSGDGLVGHLAGAEYRTGREAYAEWAESWAPEEADDRMLGSTLFFYVKDAGRAVPFVPPSFARDVSQTVLRHRHVDPLQSGCAYWWIEYGGELDIVADNESIRDELRAVVFGIWDHIKNSGAYPDTDNLTLEWAGSLPGKREYRRFVGDHVLTQNEVLDPASFPDTIGFGGWSIDLHPPGGMFAEGPGSLHWYPDAVYDIPLRSLYSRNVANLWVAGRTISATHVAFGSTRVMATCAVTGEAVGIAAALALRSGVSPRAVATDKVSELRYELSRADASVVGLNDHDPRDLARDAEVSASSQLCRLSSSDSELVGDYATHELSSPLGLVIPADAMTRTIDFAIDADSPMELTLGVHGTASPRHYLPGSLLSETTQSVTAGRSWARFELHNELTGRDENVFLVLRAPTAGGERARVLLAGEAISGVFPLRYRVIPEEERYPELWRLWRPIDHHQPPLVRTDSESAAWAPARVIDGFLRPWGGPRTWASLPLSEDPSPSLTLRWPQPVRVTAVDLVFDDDVDEDLINLHHHRSPFRVMPTLPRDYVVEIEQDGRWETVARETGNRRRHRTHRIEGEAAVGSIRITVEATNGASRAHLVALRAYSDSR